MQWIPLLAQSAEESGFVGFPLLLVMIVMLVSLWKIFEKAGQPGWAAIIPFYNLYIMLKIVDRPVWWMVLLIIPFVNFVVSIILTLEFVRAFGKDGLFGALAVILPFIAYPILGFGDAEYQGPRPLF